MFMRNIKFVIFTVILIAATLTAQTGRINTPAPDFELKDNTGTSHKLSDYKGKVVVLEWVNYQCPFVKKHYGSENMQKLQKAYTEKGIVWLSICSSAEGNQGYFEGEELTEQIIKSGSNATAYLTDSQGNVGKMYGAKNTPHMFIIDSAGNLVYAGGIDDIRSTDQADIPKAKNYIKPALDELLSGSKVSMQSTQSYGCSVKYAD